MVVYFTFPGVRLRTKKLMETWMPKALGLVPEMLALKMRR